MDPRIIVGLGNPGRGYLRHRHNLGFRVVDAWAKDKGIRLWRRICKAAVGKGEVAGHSVILAKPQTFMNRSGESVGLLLARYGASPESLIVIHDDLDLDHGVVKLKEGGGHGGHNGLRSIIARCGPDFVRLRIGIGRPEAGVDPAEYVLRNISQAAAEEAVSRAGEMLDGLLAWGLAEAMNHFHARD